MLTGIRQKTVVKEGGKIELPFSELPICTKVEVIVLVEADELDTTEYLLSHEANRLHLQKAISELNEPDKYVYVNPSDL